MRKLPFNKANLLVTDNINYNLISKLNEISSNALNDYRHIFTSTFYYINFQSIVYTEFFKESMNSYERALFFIKKMERMGKTRSRPGRRFIILLKLGILIIEDAKIHNEKFIMDKYHSALVEIIKFFIKTTSGVNLLDRYGILVHVAQVTNLKFIWKLAEDFYRVLLKEIPEVINPILNKITSSK